MRGLLESNRFTGYATYPVVVRIGERTLTDYDGLSILGRAGPEDFEKSKAKFGPKGGAPIAMDGLYFDPHNWDGSDIFQVGENSSLLMVERVWRCLQDAKVTNFKPMPLDEWGFGYERLCPQCRGRRNCPRCGGIGVVQAHACVTCGGIGKCPECGGAGLVKTIR